MRDDSSRGPVRERRASGRRTLVRRPRVEDLEGRCLLTTITELPGVAASAGALDLVKGPDGNLWFTEFQSAGIGKITPTGTVTEFSAGITADAGPLGIASDAAGNLWFTEFNASQIGKITTSGTVTEFSTGISPDSSPVGIAADGSGNFWFTEFDGDQIGKITPTGTVTEFATGITPNSGAAGIVLGPDGNLWFTEFYGSRIGRITPSGVVTEFSTGISPNSEPAEITVGPDGNLWFTELAGSRIGRITTAGVVTEFSTGITSGSGPAGIVTGPEGNLWFTEYNASQIGRITPAGVVTEFTAGITPASTPAGIAIGPDGNPWFAEEATGKFGKIDPFATVAETTQTHLVAAPTSSTFNQSVNFTATVTATAGTPTGAVTFTVDGVARPAVNLQSVDGVEQAVLPLSNLAPGTHRIQAMYDGVEGFATSPSNVVNQVVTVTTQAHLRAAPNPATVGLPVTFTVTVSPALANVPPTAFGGRVNFSDGTTVLGFAKVSAAGTATFTTAFRVAGSHQIIAHYTGDGIHDPIASAAVAEVVRPPSDGPRVGLVLRYGYHWMPTTLVVIFTSPLDPARAQNPSNYLIVGPGGRVIPVSSATYDATADAVIVSPVERLNLHDVYRLILVGTGPLGLSGPGGVLLDGAGNGRPGSNFVTTLSASNWVIGPILSRPFVPGLSLYPRV